MDIRWKNPESIHQKIQEFPSSSDPEIRKIEERRVGGFSQIIIIKAGGASLGILLPWMIASPWPFIYLLAFVSSWLEGISSNGIFDYITSMAGSNSGSAVRILSYVSISGIWSLSFGIVPIGVQISQTSLIGLRVIMGILSIGGLFTTLLTKRTVLTWKIALGLMFCFLGTELFFSFSMDSKLGADILFAVYILGAVTSWFFRSHVR